MELSLIIKLLIILAVSLSCSIQDIKYQKVSNWKIFSGIFLMIIYNIIFQRNFILQILFSASMIFIIFILIKLFLKTGIGWADVYFSLFIRLSLTYISAALSILIAVFTGFIYILIKHIKDKSLKIKEIKLPFIPFLSAGLIAGFFTDLIIL